ncbi:MAG: 3-hydroxybutyryl-CoA dehydrogenase [Deltaproteobacteria bacterium]|nr:3-hydroxybutyryl-CoA dehydrogenase [Deltaproteobacteria bacterium]
MDIKTVGVIGAGQMGAGIAQVAAMSGFKCFLWDANRAALEKGMEGIKAQLKKMVEKEKISAEQSSQTLANLTPAKALSEYAACDMVVEAIIENLDIKLKVFAELDSILPANSLLTSNTSSISITRLAAGTKRPDKVMGAHFMNPVPVMKLVELIRGLQTSDETYAAVKAASEKMGKTTVLAVDSPGFIVNRILCPMLNEAVYLVQEGVKPEDVDNGMKLGTNQPMGPLTLADFIGLDTLLYVLRILHSELGEDKYRPCPLLVKYVEAGWYGKKTGRGFYKY